MSPPTPVVFLHGLGQTPQDWQDQVVALPPGTPMLAPWVPGLSPRDRGGFELDAAVDGILAQLDAQGWVAPVDLCGLSLGAMVALRLAARHPERVRRLVLCGAQVNPPRAVVRLQGALLKATPVAAFQGSHALKKRVLEAARALTALDLRADLRRVTAPTLVLVGARDRPNAAAARAVAHGIAEAVLTTVPGGHRLNTDNPAGFNEQLVGWLSS